MLCDPLRNWLRQSASDGGASFLSGSWTLEGPKIQYGRRFLQKMFKKNTWFIQGA